jgi:hypothetical protein
MSETSSRGIFCQAKGLARTSSGMMIITTLIAADLRPAIWSAVIEFE